jgi:hypothetical protein
MPWFYNPMRLHLLKVYHGPGTVKQITDVTLLDFLSSIYFPSTESIFVLITLASTFLELRSLYLSLRGKGEVYFVKC